MSVRDRITDALGSVIGGGISLLSESIEKAASPKTDGTMAMAMDAEKAPLPQDPVKEPPTGLMVDPFAIVDQFGYRDRPSSLTYDTLRRMAYRVSTYTGILQTRVGQVASFAKRQRDKRDPGFGIKLRDEKASPTKEDLKRMRWLEDFILQTGVEWAPGRDSFKTFLRKLTIDSLILDQGCFEIQRNRKGLPAAFYAMDGGTIRLADLPPGVQSSADPELVRYVQVYDEVVIAEFASQDLCFGVRNPRSDIRVNGYGYSELEMLIEVITASLWSFDYNKRQFSQGTLVNGVMNFKGSVPDKKVDAFRRQWKMMISGVGNSHRVPMTNVDELQWIDFGKTNRDMEFGAWMDWLIKVTAAVMQFDPAEINFNYGNSGQSNQMFSTPVDSKLKASKDRGLRPLLEDIQDWINIHLIWPLDPYFEFRFLGLDAKSADQSIDQGKKRGEFLMTIDELRAEEDLDPLPDGQGEVILNQVWLQHAQAGEAGGTEDQGGWGGGNGEGVEEGSEGDEEEDLEAPEDEGERYDFDKMFPKKSMADRTDLIKAGSAKIRVYDIEL